MNLQKSGGMLNNLKMIFMTRLILKIVPALIIMLYYVSSIIAQETSAGLCYYNDYLIWDELGYPDVHGNCEASDVFNVGAELTMETWIRAYSFGENRKVLGKMSDAFNNGYVLGYENLHVYSEIFNPEKQEIPREGTGSLHVDSAWVHLATTYSATGKMVNYINGEAVGEITIFPQNNIADNNADFIIGRAPWGYSFVFYGNLDEIRIWNIQHDADQIKNLMFKELQGDEEGLVAYYNFNAPSDSVFYDNSGNTNNGVIKKYEETCFWWETSYAPVGDTNMYEMQNVEGAWCGKSHEYFNYAFSENGFSLITDIVQKEFEKYVIFGHNGLDGLTTEDIPDDAADDFQRTNRVWYLNQGGEFTSELYFNVEDAAGGGDMLPAEGENIYYTLLYKRNKSDNFEPLYAAIEAYQNTVSFYPVDFKDGYYSVGYGSSQLAIPAKAGNLTLESQIKIYPNPASNYFQIQKAKGFKMTIYDLAGRILIEDEILNHNHITDVNNLHVGIYIVNLKYNTISINKKIAIN